MAGNMSGLQKTVWGLMFVFASAAAEAEVLGDPTRPPLAVSAPTATDGQAAAADRGLQSVIIAPGRRAAIINGQTVELGGKYGDARLVAVSERGVMLRGPQGKQELTLFPGVVIKKNMAQVAPKPLAAKPVSSEKTAGKNAAGKAAPQEEK